MEDLRKGGTFVMKLHCAIVGEPWRVYTDSKCSKESQYSYEDYQSAAASSLMATATSGAFEAWNAGMDSYNICQPCRAYNWKETEYASSGSSNDPGRKRTAEYNDGQGDEDQTGFICYNNVWYHK